MVSRPSRDLPLVWGMSLAGVLAALVGPFPVTNGVARLAGWILLAAGASVVVGRTGTVDLSTAAVAALGAYAGAVWFPLAGGVPALGVLVGVLAGAAAGAVTGGLVGRVGALLAALPSLAVTVAVGAALRATPAVGGAAGYHAAPFLTGGEVGDAVAAVLLAAGAVTGVSAWWWRPAAARASVGARAPAVLAATGRRPAIATAAAGALGGAILGAGGAVQTMVSGSVSPGAFGLGLAAALALAAVLGGAPPFGPVVGALFLWGPSVLFPLAPVVGDAPPLLTTGVAGLALLAWRRGRPLVLSHPPHRRAADSEPGLLPEEGRDHPVLEVSAGAGHDGLAVHPGDVVAVVGPNGAGKSTLLARIGGQLPDHGGVRLHGRPAPRGSVARARLGVSRTWQRHPPVPSEDLQGCAGPGRGPLPPAVTGLLAQADPDARAQVELALSGRPTVLLLDEPLPGVPEEDVAALLRLLATAGVGVVVVDHRPAVLSVADRTCHVRTEEES